MNAAFGNEPSPLHFEFQLSLGLAQRQPAEHSEVAKLKTQKTTERHLHSIVYLFSTVKPKKAA
ncbi:MAG: hypothetical protein D8B42_01530 [Kingella sp. (in: b-proteobacteria)]|uniref:Uncharacterized protein n=1 Tax=Kingella oralis ATCC 51147 TaxID=629741 RepID=C4GJA9_9NEIS|nr:hypothetical protein GCWU000324_02132 [Kingella oralis ATCC 51147]RKW32765.1 MAG: hypothetical protein D8B42_01530 [Kingella sp. (in: b-proteobacteria)]